MYIESGKTNLPPMGRSITLLFSILLQLAIHHGAAQQVMMAHQCNGTSGNYTSTSTYKSNLNTLLTTISSNTNISYGFFNFSSGKNPDQVNGLALCRGDLGVSDCNTCLDFVISNLTALCPNQKEAIGWADTCMLRYSSRDIFAVWQDNPFWVLTNGSYADNDAQFMSVQNTLMDSVKNKAILGDSRLKFATQVASINASASMYMLMQCSPDLTQLHCVQCLYRVIAYSQAQSTYYSERVLLPSCNMRYELYKFYNSSDSTANAPQSSHNFSDVTGKSSGSTVVIAVAVVASIAVLLIILLLLYLRQRRKMWKKFKIKLDEDDEIGGIQSLQYDFGTIKAATGNFAEVNKVGHGGFGDVYKGKMANGREVAVKRLAKFSGQEELEFKNEVVIVAKLQHRNLVRLFGFCLEDQERLLIYEFVPNASLDHFLFDETRKVQLNWEKRYEIIGGIARGLLYLHEGSRLRIIHRDLKPSNVLLDAEMRPKIADFGTVRLFQADQTQLDTRRIVGTHGYMAPEYALHGLFSIKSDVYSFGVLVLEILTGLRCIRFRDDGEAFEDLVTLVWRNWNLERALDIVDPVISMAGFESEIMRCIQIALLCVQDSAADRPAMSSVVHMLSAQDFDLAEPYQPSYVMTSSLPADSREFGSSRVLI